MRCAWVGGGRRSWWRTPLWWLAWIVAALLALTGLFFFVVGLIVAEGWRDVAAAIEILLTGAYVAGVVMYGAAVFGLSASSDLTSELRSLKERRGWSPMDLSPLVARYRSASSSVLPTVSRESLHREETAGAFEGTLVRLPGATTSHAVSRIAGAVNVSLGRHLVSHRWLYPAALVLKDATIVISPETLTSDSIYLHHPALSDRHDQLLSVLDGERVVIHGRVRRIPASTFDGDVRALEGGHVFAFVGTHEHPIVLEANHARRLRRGEVRELDRA